MQQREILELSGEKIDFRRGFIRLDSDDTKTKEGRIIPLSLTTELETMPRRQAEKKPRHLPEVFLRSGQPIRDIREADLLSAATNLTPI